MLRNRLAAAGTDAAGAAICAEPFTTVKLLAPNDVASVMLAT